jgi:tetratricopeptide (TPR) repeat protein
MKQIAPLLEAGKPQEYVAGVEQLLETAKGQNLRKILTMNLAAGYIDLKQFDKAIELLEGISDKKLAGTAVKTVYRLNLCTCYFNTDQGEKALKLYNDSQKIFEAQRGGKLYGVNIAVVDMLAAIQNRRYDQAEQLLDQARRTWDDPRFREAFQEIERTLTEIKKESTL